MARPAPVPPPDDVEALRRENRRFRSELAHARIELADLGNRLAFLSRELEEARAEVERRTTKS